MQDKLGARMKEKYENRTRYLLPRRTYTLIRIDGKAFHTFTRGFKRPFDIDLMDVMDKTAIALVEQIQGAKMAFVQSDEISIVMTDFEKHETDAWFDGNIQKITSISASIATQAFRNAMGKRARADDPKWWTKDGSFKTALFDARVFTIPDREEMINYFIWRQQDATKNSILSAAQAVFSHKEMHGKNTSVLQDMLHSKGINWNNYTSREKRGGLIIRTTYTKPSEVLADTDTGFGPVKSEPAIRHRWEAVECPIFTQDKDLFNRVVPKNVV